jgi:aarF domain-containing kinase
LQLDDGRLGLIDYGQTRRMDDIQRRQFARIVVALHEDAAPQVTAAAMRAAGFVTRNNADDTMMCRYACLLFDSDEDSMRNGFCIPQVGLFCFVHSIFC